MLGVRSACPACLRAMCSWLLLLLLSRSQLGPNPCCPACELHWAARTSHAAWRTYVHFFFKQAQPCTSINLFFNRLQTCRRARASWAAWRVP